MIGILALQGAFEKHAEMFRKLGEPTCFVRRPSDLDGCLGLAIPGGESTAMRVHLKRVEMTSVLKRFAGDFPVFGTCAGLILMASDLKILDVEVRRNGYGPQVYSFSWPLDSDAFPDFQGVFIRAPRIQAAGDGVDVLARISHKISSEGGQDVRPDCTDSPRGCEKCGLTSCRGEPVLVRQGRHLAATFHPELTGDLRIHQQFVSMVKGGKLPSGRLSTNIENGRAAGGERPAKIQTC